MDDLYEGCREELQALITWYAGREANRNEATTRLHLIDTLFLQCLGWNKDDVTVEESHEGEYADYSFKAPRRILIVEAKREGAYFEIPAGMTRPEYSLKGLSRDNPALGDALRQVTDYCQHRGVPIGVVCNGHQLVAFVATRTDGIPPLEGRGLVFPSPDSMLARFIDLWQALSKPGIQEANLSNRLLRSRGRAVPAKLSTMIASYPGLKGRNVFQTDLQIVSELVLEDISRSPELEKTFLRECYCESGALSQHSLLSKAILSARYAALFSPDSPGPTTVPAVSKDGVAEELLGESLVRRPILIVGDVGVGKTTFIRYLHKIDAEELLSTAIVLYVDLGSQATLAADLRDFFLDETERQLLAEYYIDLREGNFIRGVYNVDLERFRRGLYAELKESNPDLYCEKEIEYLEQHVSNKDEHLRRSIRHLVKGRKKQVVIFIDNADQREDSIQQQAFLIAQELARHTPAAVFVSLRPQTVHRSLRRGALSGYHAKAFAISPPRIDRVLDTRLRFGLKIASGQIPVTSLDTVHLRVAALRDVIVVFLQSMEYDNRLIELIDNISGGNVRLALDTVRNFLGSGHVDTEKIVGIYRERGRYWIPIHEFLRALIYGESQHFDPSSSLVANLYDLSSRDPKEHFLLSILLSFLAASSNEGVTEGFVETTRLYDHAQSVGFVPEQVDAALFRAARHGLVETVARSPFEIAGPKAPALRATSIGLYHVMRLCRMFTYIDAIIVDTPILDSKVRASIRNVDTIRDRLGRAMVFLRYMDGQWRELGGTCPYFDWASVSRDVADEIASIGQKILSS